MNSHYRSYRKGSRKLDGASLRRETLAVDTGKKRLSFAHDQPHAYGRNAVGSYVAIQFARATVQR